MLEVHSSRELSHNPRSPAHEDGDAYCNDELLHCRWMHLSQLTHRERPLPHVLGKGGCVDHTAVTTNGVDDYQGV